MSWAERWHRKGLLWALLLKPLSWAYGAGWALVRGIRLRGPKRFAVPVISVGNLSVGGTGKSPLVRALAQRAASRRLQAAILLRGYGAERGERPLLVSAGEAPLVHAQDSGDEAFEHAQQSSSQVWVDPDRRRSAKAAVAAGAQVLVLDDGFQRRGQVCRDLDLVLADWQEIQDGEHLLPAGPWREPWSQLKDADAVLLSGAPASHHDEAWKGSLPLPWRGKPVFRLDRVAVGLQAWPDGGTLPLARLQGASVLALSGLGRPASFEASLAALGAKVRPWRFKDHHAFGLGDLLAPVSDADAIVTTAKDAVRLPAHWRPALPVWVLRVEARVSPSRQFWAMVDQALGRHSSRGR